MPTEASAAGSMSGITEDLEWRIDDAPVDYARAVEEMEARAAAIRAGGAPEMVWLLEHPALFTAGTSARPTDLLDDLGLPVIRTGRGGRFTYHGPGQRVAYVMLDLDRRGRDLRRFVNALEGWIIDTLGRFNVRGERREGRVGIWVDRSRERGPGREDKIAAIGVRVRRWVSYHGIALNVDPNLAHFAGIVPCGIEAPKLGVTSLTDLGVPVSMAEVDSALRATFTRSFPPPSPAPRRPPTRE